MAVLAYNCVEWLEIYAATAKAGLVAVPINFRLTAAEASYIVEDAEAAALIVQDELLHVAEEIGLWRKLGDDGLRKAAYRGG